MSYYNHGANSYLFNRVDNEIKFWSSDDKVVDAICECIDRYIQSENYRRLLLKLDAKDDGKVLRL